MPIIKEYTFFLSNREEVTMFDDTDKEFTINSRVKNVNSIEEKYSDYLYIRMKKEKLVSTSVSMTSLECVRLLIARIINGNHKQGMSTKRSWNDSY